MSAQPATPTCGECRIKFPLTEQWIKLAEAVASGEVSVVPCPCHAQAEALLEAAEWAVEMYGTCWDQAAACDSDDPGCPPCKARAAIAAARPSTEHAAQEEEAG